MDLEQLTPAAQDYIKLIYELTDGEGRTTTNELAAEMGVRPASVTGMVQKLAQAEPAIVDYEKWRGGGFDGDRPVAGARTDPASSPAGNVSA